MDPLTCHKFLYNEAQGHVDDMDAGDLSDRTDDVGYKWCYIGENSIAASSQILAKDAVNALMDSPGHRDNILNQIIFTTGDYFVIDVHSDAAYWIQKIVLLFDLMLVNFDCCFVLSIDSMTNTTCSPLTDSIKI